VKIQGTENLTHPARLVYETIRDRTQEMVDMMPNIDGMEVISRKEEPPFVHLYNKWQGANRDVPRVLRPFIKPDLLAWYDRAAWNEETLSCRWSIEAVVGKDFFSCEGSTTISAAGDGSVFSLAGELTVDPNRIPKVPRFLARKFKEPLERFIARAISPNLTSIARAVQQYLDRQA
jgi:hypothetical protein